MGLRVRSGLDQQAGGQSCMYVQAAGSRWQAEVLLITRV